MCTVFESQSEHQDTEIPVSVANTNSGSLGQSQISQSSTHRNFFVAAKSSQAPAVNYSSIVRNLPAILPAEVTDIANFDALSATDNSSIVSNSILSSVSTVSEPAIAEELVPALHGRLDMADNSGDEEYFNPERFSTWLYLHCHAPGSLPGSDRVSTVGSDGRSYGLFAYFAHFKYHSNSRISRSWLRTRSPFVSGKVNLPSTDGASVYFVR
jgi:hypothetical protein